MTRNIIFNRMAAIFSVLALASMAFVATAGAHTAAKSDTLTFPIPTTPGGEATVMGQKVHLPRNLTGQAVLSYDVVGQTSDLIVSEAAANDCTAPNDPFIGVDFISSGGNVAASLRITGTSVGADGQAKSYDSGPLGGQQSLGSPGSKTDVASLCLDL